MREHLVPAFKAIAAGLDHPSKPFMPIYVGLKAPIRALALSFPEH